jgi:FkbM family methyltransferase
VLIPAAEMFPRWGITGSVLHVGAHTGEEGQWYQDAGFDPCYWIEADPEVVPQLEEHLCFIADGKTHHYVVEAVVSDGEHEVQFNIANNEESSSLLALKTHAQEHPEVVFTKSITVTTTTIDDLLHDGTIKRAPFMNLDIQGAELLALKGARDYLDSVKWIYSEVNVKELYAGGALLPQLDTFLDRLGFVRQETVMTPHGWGDALYCR